MSAHSAICQCPDCELRRKVEACAEIEILRQSAAPTAIIYPNGDRPRALPLRDWNEPLRVDDDVEKLKGEAKRFSKFERSLRTIRRGAHWSPPRYLLAESELDLRADYHKHVRLFQNRNQAAATRRRGGDVTRKIVFALIRQALNAGAERRQIRGRIKSIATAERLTIPHDWQLGKIIAEFFKVDTTT